MNQNEYLLTQLASEAAEVAHIVTKMLQFGGSEAMPGQPYTNAQRVTQEILDLMGVLSMVVDEGLLNMPEGLAFDDIIERKRVKVRKYMAYAMGEAPHPMVQTTAP
jgi:hypothetical protein